MFRRFPGKGSLSGGRLGLWETSAESEATEKIHRLEKSGGLMEEPQGVSEAFRRIAPNLARQIHWDQK